DRGFEKSQSENKNFETEEIYPEKMYDGIVSVNDWETAFGIGPYSIMKGGRIRVVNQVGSKSEGIMAAPKVEMAQFTPPKIVQDEDFAGDWNKAVESNV